MSETRKDKLLMCCIYIKPTWLINSSSKFNWEFCPPFPQLPKYELPIDQTEVSPSK